MKFKEILYENLIKRLAHNISNIDNEVDILLINEKDHSVLNQLNKCIYALEKAKKLDKYPFILDLFDNFYATHYDKLHKDNMINVAHILSKYQEYLSSNL